MVRVLEIRLPLVAKQTIQIGHSFYECPINIYEKYGIDLTKQMNSI